MFPWKKDKNSKRNSGTKEELAARLENFRAKVRAGDPIAVAKETQRRQNISLTKKSKK